MRSVSIIICTRDRADSLWLTLEAIGKVNIPSDTSPELIVADNGSSDHTAQVCQRSLANGIPLRYVKATTKGKGYAYSAATAIARGEVLLFTDDDVRPPREWLAAMTQPLLHDGVDFLSGRVRIAPHLERPWLVRHLRGMFALTDGPPESVPMVLGANMAIRKAVFDTTSGFDLNLGPGAMGGGDEVLLYRQIVHAGFRAATAVGGMVEHHFSEARLSRPSVLAMAAAYGRCDAYIMHHWEHGYPRLPLLRSWLGKCALQVLRFLRRPGSHPDRCEEWEVLRVARIARLEHIAQLKSSPRLYPRRGIIRNPRSFRTATA